MRQSVRILHQCLDKIPGGFDNQTREPVNVADGKIVLPAKDKVMSGMEELIHQFMLVTQGMNVPPEKFISATRTRRANSVFTSTAARRHAVPDEDSLALVCEPEHLSQLLPGYMMSDITAILGSLDS